MSFHDFPFFPSSMSLVTIFVTAPKTAKTSLLTSSLYMSVLAKHNSNIG